MAHVFDALGDTTRRHVLVVLAAGEQSVGAIVVAMQARGPISQPAVSQHLKVLRDAGLVRVRAEGTRRLHALDEDGIAAARAWLARLLDPLAGVAQPLDALETELARGRRERRTSPAARSGHQPDATDRPA